MALFRSKKKEKQHDSDKEDGAIELFRVATLSSGESEATAQRLERELFGRAFEDLLSEGYVPSIGIKADDGGLWTALGKVPVDRLTR